jgi:hypothetical protein
VLADPPAVADPEQPSQQAPGATPPGASPTSPDPAQVATGPTCAKCGAPIAPGQDWCLQCGAGVPGSLDAGGPSWRSAATILTATAVLVLGAAAAAYAALNKESGHKVTPTVVAVATTPAAATPTSTTPITPTPTTPGAATPTPKASTTTPATTNPLVSPGTAKPPKIPLTAPTPKSSGTTTTPASTTKESTPTTTTPASGGESGGEAATEPQPSAIVLDPDAAKTYNPYNYPASEFGDPSLAIDGDTSTEWTAQVNPAVAPKMAEGLAVDLNSPQRLSAIELVTSTPGMSVQVYGAKTSSLPTSITDPSWVQLTPYLTVKKRHERIKLQDSGKGFRFVTLWISKASASSVGTSSEPGHVSVNELELFPAK